MAWIATLGHISGHRTGMATKLMIQWWSASKALTSENSSRGMGTTPSSSIRHRSWGIYKRSSLDLRAISGTMGRAHSKRANSKVSIDDISRPRWIGSWGYIDRLVCSQGYTTALVEVCSSSGHHTYNDSISAGKVQAKKAEESWRTTAISIWKVTFRDILITSVQYLAFSRSTV